MSDLLLKSLRDQEQKSMLQRMEIVPLQTSELVGSLNASLFFPTCDGIDISGNLSITLVYNDTLKKVSFTALLKGLGVTDCRPDQVIPLIESRYVAGIKMSGWLVEQHLKFLF